MIKLILLVLCTELCMVTGQVFFKKSTNHFGSPDLKNFSAYLHFAQTILKMPQVWLGLLCMGTGLVFWIAALSESHLSFVYPLGSLQYLLTLLASRIFLNERIDGPKLAGTLLVMAGIVVITLS